MRVNPTAAQIFLSQALDCKRPENHHWNELEKATANETMKLWEKRIEQFDRDYLQKLEARIIDQTEKLEIIHKGLRKSRTAISVLAKLDTQIQNYHCTRRILLTRAYQDLSSILTANDVQKCTSKDNKLTRLYREIYGNKPEEHQVPVTAARYDKIMHEVHEVFSKIDEKTLKKIDSLKRTSTQKFDALAKCTTELDKLSSKLGDIGLTVCSHRDNELEAELRKPSHLGAILTAEHLDNTINLMSDYVLPIRANHNAINIKFSELRKAHGLILGLRTESPVKSEPSLIFQAHSHASETTSKPS